MLEKKIAFIGSGAMAEAMISGLLRQKLATPENLRTSDTRIERVEELQKKYGVVPFTDNNLAAEQADVIVLSVKPQRLT
jgi:pyrroline-5-carboxylate reductase